MKRNFSSENRSKEQTKKIFSLNALQLTALIIMPLFFMALVIKLKERTTIDSESEVIVRTYQKEKSYPQTAASVEDLEEAK